MVWEGYWLRFHKCNHFNLHRVFGGDNPMTGFDLLSLVMPVGAALT